MMLFPEETPNYSSATFPTLRPFQMLAHESLRDGVRGKHRVQMIMAPTGAGKTILAMNIIKEALDRGKRCLFLCDRKTLIKQTSKVADELGLSAHGIIQAKNPRMNLKLRFQIGSVQTVQRRGIPDGFDVVVIDEAHTLYKAISKHIQSCTAHVIGLSATPFSSGLGNIYSNLINAATMYDLTEAGYLVPMRPFSCTKIDMKDAKTAAGEWTIEAAGERGMEIVGDVVTEWAKFACDRKTIVFGATIAHCREMAKQFNAAGYMAEVFCADTTDDERKAILDEFEKPDSELRILVSVDALAKGFDVKDIGCVCDCRPLRKSLSTAIQMWGRGLRASLETGKVDCLLLDFSGNIVRFADDFAKIFYKGLESLDAGEKLDKTVRKDSAKEPAKCPKCGFTPCGKICIGCGYEKPAKVSNVQARAGVMAEITLGGKKLADDARHLYAQICTYTRTTGNPNTAKGRAFRHYQDLNGNKMPDRSWKFEDMPDVPVSSHVTNKIKSLRIAYLNRRSKMQGGFDAGNQTH